MTDLSLSEIEAVATRHPDLFQQGGLRRFLPVFVVAAVAAYLGYVWVFFDVSKVLDRADWEIAGNYLADWIAYEIRPDLHLEDGYISVSYPRYSPLGSDPHPEWVILERADVTIKEVVDAPQDATSAQTQSGFMVNAPVVPEAGNAVADPLAVPTKPSGFMGAGGLVGTKVDEAAPTEVQTRMSNEVVSAQVEIGDAVISVYPDHTEIDRANGERLLIRTSLENGVTAEGALPDWAEQKEVGGKIRMFFGFAGRVEVENDDVKVRRRFLGWENFFFDTRSAFWGKTLGEVVQMILSSEEIVPGKANWQVAYSDIANNSEWQHGDVWTKLLQTIVMAFMGTLLASMTAFPLAFLAARNISPNLLLNQGLKRLFDFLRSVDMLIWALCSPAPSVPDRWQVFRQSSSRTPEPSASSIPRRSKTSTTSSAKASGPWARHPCWSRNMVSFRRFCRCS